MFHWILFVTSLCVFSNDVCTIPLNPYGTTPIQFVPIKLLPSINSETRAPDRFFWSALGNFIQSSSFLPIEVNVPDTINTIYTGAVSGAAERFPLINRWITGTEPRPYPSNVLVLLPINHQSQQNSKDHLIEKFFGLHLPNSIQDLKYIPKKTKPTVENNQKIVSEHSSNHNCTSENNSQELEDIEAQKVLIEYLDKVKQHNKLFKNGIHGDRLIVPEPIMPTYLDTNVRNANDFGYIRGGYGLYP